MPRAYEHRLGSKLHYKRGVGGGGDSSGGEIWDGEFPIARDHFDQLVGSAVFFGFGVEFFFAQHGENSHLLHDLANVADGVDHVSGAGFAFGANHGRAFGDAAQGLAEVAGSADEGNFEGMLVDVMSFVRGSKDFGFVDVVDA